MQEFAVPGPSTWVPPEILSQVFTGLLHSSRDTWKRYPYMLVDVAQVSPYWRSVALAYPHLWAYVVCRDPEATAVFLKRSQDAPLHIMFFESYQSGFGLYRNRFMSQQSASSFDLVLHEASRIASFDLEIGWQSPLLTSLRTLPSRRPLLNSVHLISSDLRACDDIRAATSFILRDAPHVQSLTLNGHSKAWSTIRFPATLKHLDMRASDPVNTYSGMVITLQSLHCLETVRIQGLGSLPHDIANISRSYVPIAVPLPQLRKMDLIDQNLHSAAFLRHFSLSSSCALSFSITRSYNPNKEYERGHVRDFATTLFDTWLRDPCDVASISPSLRNLSHLAFTSKKIEARHCFEFIIRGWRLREDSPPFRIDSNSPDLTVNLTLSTANGARDFGLVAFCKNLDLGELRVADLDTTSLTLSHYTLPDILRRADKLRKLVLRGPHACADATLLMQLDPPVSPTLKILDVSCAGLDKETAEKLAGALEHRLEQEVPVGELRLTGTAAPMRRRMKQLRKVVSVLKFDHHHS
ncbi:hypothetical protein EIP91_001833 [Steccherinum ochraceum]|uniref:Uncharacterized protein n=1 Tax=Steccherinum ochraceum TaxID=92696 RepID=A0A4R0RJK7_9APHY|nr:hypothetical protein EIP91_001833 [Steccherinum ochraceum]